MQRANGAGGSRPEIARPMKSVQWDDGVSYRITDETDVMREGVDQVIDVRHGGALREQVDWTKNEYTAWLDGRRQIEGIPEDSLDLRKAYDPKDIPQAPHEQPHGRFDASRLAAFEAMATPVPNVDGSIDKPGPSRRLKPFFPDVDTQKVLKQWKGAKFPTKISGAPDFPAKYMKNRFPAVQKVLKFDPQSLPLLRTGAATTAEAGFAFLGVGATELIYASQANGSFDGYFDCWLSRFPSPVTYVWTLATMDEHDPCSPVDEYGNHRDTAEISPWALFWRMAFPAGEMLVDKDVDGDGLKEGFWTRFIGSMEEMGDGAVDFFDKSEDGTGWEENGKTIFVMAGRTVKDGWDELVDTSSDVVDAVGNAAEEAYHEVAEGASDAWDEFKGWFD